MALHVEGHFFKSPCKIVYYFLKDVIFITAEAIYSCYTNIVKNITK